MGLERVIDEIVSSGEEKRRAIISEGEKERQRIVAASREEAESGAKALETDTESRISLMRQQALSSAELEAKKRILREQNEQLSLVREEVLRDLSSRSRAELKPILDKLAKMVTKGLSGGVIHCRKQDEVAIVAPSRFKKQSDLRASGGLIAESEDGSYRIDLTFEALIEDVWNRNVRQIYEILFGGA